MQFEAARARGLFERAASSLPHRDRRTLFPAEIMRAIYQTILERISADVDRVLDGKVTLSRPRKLGLAAGVYLRSRFA
jgi:phytoene synthase